MSEFDDRSICRKVKTRDGYTEVCVVPNEDMDRKCFQIIFPNGKQEKRDKLHDVTKLLLDNGAKQKDLVAVVTLAHKHLRPLRSHSERTKAGIPGIAEAEASEKKEV